MARVPHDPNDLREAAAGARGRRRVAGQLGRMCSLCGLPPDDPIHSVGPERHEEAPLRLYGRQPMPRLEPPAVTAVRRDALVQAVLDALNVEDLRVVANAIRRSGPFGEDWRKTADRLDAAADALRALEAEQ
jgi:hypothetical protein